MSINGPYTIESIISLYNNILLIDNNYFEKVIILLEEIIKDVNLPEEYIINNMSIIENKISNYIIKKYNSNNKLLISFNK